jgi:hypothetical protein
MTDKTTNHELMHPVGDASAWSESYYFNFVDPESRIGMFTRMGFRPGDGWADALHAIYLPGSQVAFTYGRRDIAPNLLQYNGDLSAGNLTLTLVEPHECWRIDYDGPAQNIADAAVLLERSKLRPPGWFRDARLTMSLNFNCTTEPHFTFSQDGSTGAYGHFEQSGHVTGKIKLDDQEWQVNGFGVRDKSWGPRDWGAGQRQADTGTASNGPVFSTAAAPAPFVNWFSMNFGADTALGGSCFRQPSGEIKGAGWIQRDGKSMHLKDVVITTEYRRNSILHDAVRLTGTIDGKEPVEITGRILNMCPTKVPMPGGATFINEGLAEFQWNGTTGFGIAEHWHAVTKSD